MSTEQRIDVDEYRQWLEEGIACAGDLVGDLLIALLWEEIGGQDTPAAEVRRLADETGLPWGTVRRLKKRFGIESIRKDGVWLWHLPPACEDEDPLLTLTRVATAENWIPKRAAYRRGAFLEEL